MGNLRNKINCKFTSKRLFQMDIKTKLYFTRSYIAIPKNKVTLTLNKPAYVSMCILELSKVLLYAFHSDYNENKYGNNPRLLFIESDSLIYEIKTEDGYEKFSNDKKMFDFSNYSKVKILQ